TKQDEHPVIATMNTKRRIRMTLSAVVAALPLLAAQASQNSPPTAAPAPASAPSSVIELRQYKIFPGKRDQMIQLFEREFIARQELVGMRLVGTFRDQRDADRFTWIREFASMDVRDRELSAFYFGPVWKAHRNEANAFIDDSDNVLLLRPAAAG